MEKNNFINKMKQLSEIENITSDIVIKNSESTKLKYPTREELENMGKNESGAYNGGAATYAPMPDDYDLQRQFANSRVDTTMKDMLAGIEEEGAASNIDTFTIATPKEEPVARKKINEKNEEKVVDANSILINNSKKQEVELELSFKAKIPVAAFFSAMDDNFVKKNQNSLLTMIIANIKMNELDKQLKEKLKEFYGLK